MRMGCTNCRPYPAMAYYDIPPRARVRMSGVQVHSRIRRRGMHGLGQTGDIPAGSQLTYTCTFSASLNPLSPSFSSESSAIAAIAQALQSQYNIALLNWQDNSSGIGTTWTVSLNVQTMTDYGAVADIKSILDGTVYNAAGGSVQSSSLALNVLASPGAAGTQTSIGTPAQILAAATAASPSQTFDIGSWLGNNWMYVAAALIGVVVLEDLL